MYTHTHTHTHALYRYLYIVNTVWNNRLNLMQGPDTNHDPASRFQILITILIRVFFTVRAYVFA